MNANDYIRLVSGGSPLSPEHKFQLARIIIRELTRAERMELARLIGGIDDR
jgi:hypothetical protein